MHRLGADGARGVCLPCEKLWKQFETISGLKHLKTFSHSGSLVALAATTNSEIGMVRARVEGVGRCANLKLHMSPGLKYPSCLGAKPPNPITNPIHWQEICPAPGMKCKNALNVSLSRSSSFALLEHACLLKPLGCGQIVSTKVSNDHLPSCAA